MYGFTLIANWRLILVAFTELSCVRLSWILSTLSVGAGIPSIYSRLTDAVVAATFNLKQAWSQFVVRQRVGFVPILKTSVIFVRKMINVGTMVQMLDNISRRSNSRASSADLFFSIRPVTTRNSTPDLQNCFRHCAQPPN